MVNNYTLTSKLLRPSMLRSVTPLYTTLEVFMLVKSIFVKSKVALYGLFYESKSQNLKFFKNVGRYLIRCPANFARTSTSSLLVY